jgi:hypothetical protein
MSTESATAWTREHSALMLIPMCEYWSSLAGRSG